MGNQPSSNNKTYFTKLDNLQTEMEVNVATSFDRNTILLEINGIKIQTLVDSGASVSCIQKKIFDKINKDDRFSTFKNCPYCWCWRRMTRCFR